MTDFLNWYLIWSIILAAGVFVGLPVGIILLVQRARQATPARQKLFLFLGLGLIAIAPLAFAMLIIKPYAEMQKEIGQANFNENTADQEAEDFWQMRKTAATDSRFFLPYTRVSNPDNTEQIVYRANFKPDAFFISDINDQYTAFFGNFDQTSYLGLTSNARAGEEKIYDALLISDIFTEQNLALKEGQEISIVQNNAAGKIGLYYDGRFQAVFDWKNQEGRCRSNLPNAVQAKDLGILWSEKDRTWQSGFDSGLTDFQSWIKVK